MINNIPNYSYPQSYDPVDKLDHLEEDLQEINEIMTCFRQS